jgi:hypothetical protein
MPTALCLPSLLVAALASATTFTVGDDEGWTMGVDYIDWIRGKAFSVGDKLGE